MPPRPIWKGAISFGMVTIPIKLYGATQNKDIRFVRLRKDSHARLRQKLWDPTQDEEVAFEDVVRGYEYGKEQYVVMEESDFEGLSVESKHTIEITQFVELAQIDPIYYENAYVLEPEGVGVKAYYLLKKALEESGRVAVGKVSLRQKEHVCCLRPYDHAIALETMYYGDEVRSTADLDLPEESAQISEQEVAMARMLIDQLSGTFDVAQHRDEYRTAMERVIEAKLGSVETIPEAPARPKAQVRDLMEALKASIDAAKRERTVSSPEIREPRAGARTRARKAG